MVLKREKADRREKMRDRGERKREERKKKRWVGFCCKMNEITDEEGGDSPTRLRNLTICYHICYQIGMNQFSSIHPSNNLGDGNTLLSSSFSLRLHIRRH